jgi:hypothetical protein
MKKSIPPQHHIKTSEILKQHNFERVKLLKDCHSGYKALALYRYKNINLHKQVRHELADYLNKQIQSDTSLTNDEIIAFSAMYHLYAVIFRIQNENLVSDEYFDGKKITTHQESKNVIRLLEKNGIYSLVVCNDDMTNVPEYSYGNLERMLTRHDKSIAQSLESKVFKKMKEYVNELCNAAQHAIDSNIISNKENVQNIINENRSKSLIQRFSDTSIARRSQISLAYQVSANVCFTIN